MCSQHLDMIYDIYIFIYRSAFKILLGVLDEIFTTTRCLIYTVTSALE